MCSKKNLGQGHLKRQHPHKLKEHRTKFDRLLTCFSSFVRAFLASDCPLKYTLISVKSHFFRSVILAFSSEVISLNKKYGTFKNMHASVVLFRRVDLWLYLSPVFKEVFTEDVLCGVLVVQHFGKECGDLLCVWAELHMFT